jgi:hypothetical protein
MQPQGDPVLAAGDGDRAEIERDATQALHGAERHAERRAVVAEDERVRGVVQRERQDRVLDRL